MAREKNCSPNYIIVFILLILFFCLLIFQMRGNLASIPQYLDVPLVGKSTVDLWNP
jgi:hypothetical protein